MPVPSSINDLSTTAGSNSPAGSESPGLIDDYLRTYASYIALLRDQVASVVGVSSNVSMTVAPASISGTLTADQIVVGAALNGARYSLASFSKTINISTTGAGGMDVGSAPVSGFVAIYAIYNPATLTSALLGVNATSVIAPTIYAGANMPAGYTASALVGVWPTNSGGQMVAGKIRGRAFQSGTAAGATVVSRATNQITPLAVSLASAVPLNAISCCGILNGSSTVATTIATAVWSDGGTGDGQQCTMAPVTAAIGIFRDIVITGSQQIYYTVQALAGTPSFIINITKYTF